VNVAAKYVLYSVINMKMI